MSTALTIDHPVILDLIEQAANRLTGGDKTAAIALALRRLLEREERAAEPLFGCLRGSVQVADGVDLVTASGFDEGLTDAETGRELAH